MVILSIPRHGIFYFFGDGIEVLADGFGGFVRLHAFSFVVCYEEKAA